MILIKVTVFWTMGNILNIHIITYDYKPSHTVLGLSKITDDINDRNMVHSSVKNSGQLNSHYVTLL